MIYILCASYYGNIFISIFIALVVALICGFISEAIYKSKGYGEGYNGGFWLGFLLDVVGVIIAACMPSKKQLMLDMYLEMAKNNDSKQRKVVICRHCGHEIPRSENYCPNCGSKRLDYN